MSEITRAAIGMPFSMAMESELSRRQFHSIAQALLAERDQLRAEVAGLRTGYEAYEQANAELKAECDALRKDAERYEWICANACDLNFYAVGPAPIRGRVEIDAEQYPVSEWGSAKTELDSIIDAALGQGEQS